MPENTQRRQTGHTMHNIEHKGLYNMSQHEWEVIRLMLFKSRFTLKVAIGDIGQW